MSPAAYRQLRNLPSDDCPACSSCSCRAILVQSAAEVAWESDSPIVRSLVEGHGGTVQASSDGPGKGSTFSVRLPSVPPPSNGGMEANARPAADVSSPALKGVAPRGEVSIGSSCRDSACPRIFDGLEATGRPAHWHSQCTIWTMLLPEWLFRPEQRGRQSTARASKRRCRRPRSFSVTGPSFTSRSRRSSRLSPGGRGGKAQDLDGDHRRVSRESRESLGVGAFSVQP
jgi:hypothetical protein